MAAPAAFLGVIVGIFVAVVIIYLMIASRDFAVISEHRGRSDAPWDQLS